MTYGSKSSKSSQARVRVVLSEEMYAAKRLIQIYDRQLRVMRDQMRFYRRLGQAHKNQHVDKQRQAIAHEKRQLENTLRNWKIAKINELGPLLKTVEAEFAVLAEALVAMQASPTLTAFLASAAISLDAEPDKDSRKTQRVSINYTINILDQWKVQITQSSRTAVPVKDMDPYEDHNGYYMRPMYGSSKVQKDPAPLEIKPNYELGIRLFHQGRDSFVQAKEPLDRLLSYESALMHEKISQLLNDLYTALICVSAERKIVYTNEIAEQRQQVFI